MRKYLLFIFAVILLTGTNAGGKTFSFEYQKIVEMPENPELTVINTVGKIEIKGAPVEKMTVSAVKHVRATDQEEAEEVAEHIEIKVGQSGQKFSIKTNFMRYKNGSESFWNKLFGSGEDSFGAVDFVITVPHKCRLDIDNGGGTITISGIYDEVIAAGTSDNLSLTDIRGDLMLNSMTGDIFLNNIVGRSDITTGASNIEFHSITGAVDIHSTSGIKKGSHIMGPISISQTSGAVDVQYLTGDLKLRSTSGNISVQQEEGAVNIETHTGDVDIKTELFTDRDFYIETSTGSIDFKVPETSSGFIRIETTSGEINTKLAISIDSISQNRMTGSFGNGGPQITLRTENGDITVREF